MLTTLVAISGLIVFEAVSRYNGDGSFEAAAIALNFYTLGRCGSRGRESTLSTVILFAYWVAATFVVTYVPPGGSVGSAIGAWAVIGGLPFVVGRTLSARKMLTEELKEAMARLRDEQELNARAAAAEERNRMARELHDVIAHCMSVMVVQTGAARRVLETDMKAAREALRFVERSGREALVELRRIVGVLSRRSDDPAAPALSQLDQLIERFRSAGLPVELQIEGQLSVLSPWLDLVAYRVVQEALTNAIKHAGPARAAVRVKVGTQQLDLEVSDTGHGPSPTGANANGSATEADSDLRWLWLDPALAGLLLVVLETAVLTTSHRRGPLVLNVLAVAGIAAAAVWRRRSPLLFLILVGVLGSLMNTYLIELKNSPLIGAYFVLVPTYTIAAWAERREALIGLAIFLGGAAISELTAQRGKLGNFVGAAFTVCAAWAAGRAIRSYRLATAELRRINARLAVEREDRARLAVVGERSRIARELHAMIAHLVQAMVVQAEAALSLIGRDPKQADAAMETIESTGRVALAEMRRVLGVLRHGRDAGELAPQPGVDQIYALVQRARERGQTVELKVDGEAGNLAAGVELGLYRILENALQSVRRDSLSVALKFGVDDLELLLTAGRDGPNGWPTVAMRERLALCGGKLEPDEADQDGWRFSARMPRGLQGALA